MAAPSPQPSDQRLYCWRPSALSPQMAAIQRLIQHPLHQLQNFRITGGRPRWKRRVASPNMIPAQQMHVTCMRDAALSCHSHSVSPPIVPTIVITGIIIVSTITIFTIRSRCSEWEVPISGWAGTEYQPPWSNHTTFQFSRQHSRYVQHPALSQICVWATPSGRVNRSPTLCQSVGRCSTLRKYRRSCRGLVTQADSKRHVRTRHLPADVQAGSRVADMPIMSQSSSPTSW